MRIEVSSSIKDQIALKPVQLDADISRAQKTPSGTPERANSSQAEEKKPEDALSALLKEDNFNINFELSFHIHKETNQLIVQVLDPKTNEVIREIPPEELLLLAKKIHQLVGLLFDKKI
jgi:flagellar protein FlaG